MKFLPLPFLLLVLGCSVDRTRITVHATEADAPIVEAFTAPIPFEIKVARTKTPADDAKAARGDGINIGLVQDRDCDGCYRVDMTDERFVVHGGGVLGIQYGLAEVLEAYGFRFFHPAKTRVPAKLDLVSDAQLNRDHAPEMTVRGLHLHTLHPTEGYYDFWEPSDDHRKNAFNVLDWVIKNRGNYIQWCALDDITRDPAKVAPWRDHTQAILDEAHRRGMKAGIAIQLFGGSNLQKAYDLIDPGDNPTDNRAHIEARLQPVLSVPFDSVALSYGEFSGSDPQQFIDRTNEVYDAVQKTRPGTDLTAAIHVGDDVKVTYQGKELIYYMLVQYANPAIVSYVHSVMFYNLFEDTGLAYHHEDFSEHREYLLSHLQQNRRVAYYPESAYWVAFDNPIPTWLPLYMRSRHLDMKKLRDETLRRGIPGLKEHVLFSTGWEWGYWQQDAASLRLNYELTDGFEQVTDFFFQPYGEPGAKLSAAINATANGQHQYLLLKRLAPYFASRDGLMDLGRIRDIVSQPDRPTFESIRDLAEPEKAAFEAKIIADLTAFEAEAKARLAEVEASGMPADDRWYKEVLDGASVNALRASFVRIAWTVPLKAGRGQSAQAELDQLKSLMDQAREVVSRRREQMHDPDFRRIIRGGENATVYPYGYLREADRLCFWERELVEVSALVNGAGATVPACVDVDLQ